MWEDLWKNVFQTQVNCKKENWRDVETGNVALTLGGLAKGVSLPKISYEVRRLVQSGGHGLHLAVSCAHGEVAQEHGVVTVMFPTHGKSRGSGV